MGKSKAIGTSCETAVVNFAREQGFAKATRLPLIGGSDCSDVQFNDMFIAQVKGGHAAERASDSQIMMWWAQTLAQADNYNERFGTNAYACLVLKTKGVSHKRAGSWRVWWAPNMVLTPLISTHLDTYLEFQHYTPYLLGTPRGR